MNNFNLYDDDMSSNIKDLQIKKNIETNDFNNIKNKLDYLLNEPKIYNKPIHKKKFKKTKKCNDINSYDLLILFILFILLNNYTLVTYINLNKITYIFSLIGRGLLLIFIFYQYKKIA